MSMRTGSAVSGASRIPQAFICTATGALMDQPVLALCGHLFNKAVIGSTPACPRDGEHLKGTIELPQLKERIDTWVASNQSVRSGSRKSDQKPKSYAAIVGGSQNQFSRIASADTSFSRASSSHSVSRRETEPFVVIPDAHTDDIHGFLKISSDTFVSGSKDTWLKIWDHSGALVSEFKPNAVGGYERWITTLGLFSDGTWGSGTRDGAIIIWQPDGEQLWSTYSDADTIHRCKARNNQRVLCIAECNGTDAGLSFYTGSPGEVRLWNKETTTFTRQYKTGGQDWVYCLDVLEDNNLLTVIGTDLEHWDMTNPEEISRTLLFHESQTSSQRPFISAMRRLDYNKQHLAMTLFDGSVTLFDLHSSKRVATYKEHEGRVWAVENLQDQIFATSAEDAKIKIWDVRQANSVNSITKNPGRVSTILRISEDVLISGSCPKNLRDGSASIKFWDIRALVS